MFGYQVNNGVPIVSWYDDMADRELVNILPFIKRLVGVRDVRPLIAQYSSLHRCAALCFAQGKCLAVLRAGIGFHMRDLLCNEHSLWSAPLV